MKLKRIAVRGLIGVAVCVALCMFFSGTIENITTPKVKIAKPSQGKLVETLEVDAKLVYPEVDEQKLTLPAGQTLTISRVNVRAGYEVKAGDVVLEAKVTGYDAAAKQMQDEYNAALDAMMELERKNDKLVLRRSDQSYADSYAALRAATRTLARKKTAMEVLLRAEKAALPETGVPEGASEALAQAVAAYREAEAAQSAAQEAFNHAARYGVSDEVWTYITSRQTAQEKIADCEEKLVALEELKNSAERICAPHDGAISEVRCKAGDIYDGSTALYAITREGSTPALRAELGDADRDVKEGAKLTVKMSRDSEDAKVTGVGFTEAGARYVDVALSDDLRRTAGNLYSLSADGAKFVFSFKAAQSSCLIPASAVHGSGDSRYVYVINSRQTSFGRIKHSIEKMDVKLIAEAGGVASIQEDLSYYKIAYMEDRALREGGDVMEYVE